MPTNYDKICFVIMPFEKKKVGEAMVDFDSIYEQVFEPAINAVSLPEGGRLVARRTDKDFFAGQISDEMFSYLEYSRIAVADISGLNANVFYEIGVRHRARESGTVILRQVNAPIPFDINHVKAFPYEYEPEKQMLASRALISRVLTESLVENRVDSDVRSTLRAQLGDPPAVQKLLVECENAIRAKNTEAAIGFLARASAVVPGNAVIRLKLGLLVKDRGGTGAWDEALAHFVAASAALPTYSDAWRERGIAENKLYWAANRPAGAPSGEDSLRRALSINVNDFDARSCLGGVLKREDGRLPEALEAYTEARKVSRGHSYPLMNEIKLRAHLAGKLELGDEYQAMLARVEPSLRAQVSNPAGPMNVPWSFFDLSEARLYQGDDKEFLSILREGLKSCTKAWEPKTHRESLELLLAVKPPIPALGVALAELAVREQGLPGK